MVPPTAWTPKVSRASSYLKMALSLVQARNGTTPATTPMMIEPVASTKPAAGVMTTTPTFTGFPLGMVLGLHPVTHRAMLSAITPVVLPSLSARKLDARMIARLQKAPFAVFQLDGTAYPGNSGSPVYDAGSGVVLGIINMVFVKGLKETAITNPSGITYAIPSSYAHALLQQKAP